MHTVTIAPEAVALLGQALPPGKQVTMLNLLRFRETALYEDGSTLPPCTGRQAYYERYAPVATPMVFARGGSILFAGQAASHVVCPGDEVWDDCLIVQYPDVSRIATMFHVPEYQAVVHHRTAALIDSRLIALSEGVPGL